MNDGARRVFLSYSHKDGDIREALVDHLALLRRQGVLSIWHDRLIDAGASFDLAIKLELDTSDLVLLLISASFLASDYCYEKETSRALARHHLGQCAVVPIIARPCDWTTAPFGRLTALPTDGKPITDRRYWHDNDAALHGSDNGYSHGMTTNSGSPLDFHPAEEKAIWCRVLQSLDASERLVLIEVTISAAC